MKTEIEKLDEQIKAVLEAKKNMHHDIKETVHHPEILKTLRAQTSNLSASAQSLQAIKLILSGDVGKEFQEYYYKSSVSNADIRNSGEIFIDFLKQRGLPL